MVAELEDPENTEHSQDSDHRQIAAAGQQQAHVGRKYRQQIDDTEETDRVADRPSDAKQPQDVLYCEENCKKPFGTRQQLTMFLSDAADAIQHDCHNTQQDGYYQYYVKPFARGSVGFKNYLKQYLAPFTTGFILVGCTHSSTSYETAQFWIDVTYTLLRGTSQALRRKIHAFHNFFHFFSFFLDFIINIRGMRIAFIYEQRKCVVCEQDVDRIDHCLDK
jgi:hypothetical protein